MAKLIVESDFRDIQVIRESAVGPGKPNLIKLKGVFMQAETENGNGRKYIRSELEDEVAKFDKEMIKPGKALCELEHPDTVTINPDRACARILSLTQDNNDFIGEAVVLAADPANGILGTPCGTTLASLLQYGTSVGFSSRGVGDVDEDKIVHGFNLVTIDCVLQPSIGIYAKADGAGWFVNGILESKSFIVDAHGDIVERAYTVLENKLKKLPSRQEYRNAVLGDAVVEFFKNISK